MTPLTCIESIVIIFVCDQMDDNYLHKLLTYYKTLYPDKQRIEICYLDCVDCIMYTSNNDASNDIVDLFVFVALYNDDNIMNNMYYAILYTADINAECIIAFIENDHTECNVIDYSVTPIYTTQCGHIKITFDKHRDDLSTLSYTTAVKNIIKYLHLPETSYIGMHVVSHFKNSVNVHIFYDNGRELCRRQ